MTDGPPRIAIGLTAAEAKAAADTAELGRALGLLTKPLGLGKLFDSDGPTPRAQDVLYSKRGYDAETVLLTRVAWSLWDDGLTAPTLTQLWDRLRPDDARRLWSLMHAIARGRVGLWIQLQERRRG